MTKFDELCKSLVTFRDKRRKVFDKHGAPYRKLKERLITILDYPPELIWYESKDQEASTSGWSEYKKKEAGNKRFTPFIEDIIYFDDDTFFHAHLFLALHVSPNTWPKMVFVYGDVQVKESGEGFIIQIGDREFTAYSDTDYDVICEEIHKELLEYLTNGIDNAITEGPMKRIKGFLQEKAEQD